MNQEQEKVQDHINAQQRAALWRRNIQDASVGEIIRCTGIDDDNLCSNTDARDDHDCQACGAIDLVNRQVELIGKGALRKHSD